MERFANWSFDVVSNVSHKAVLLSIDLAEKAVSVEWINNLAKWLFGEKCATSLSFVDLKGAIIFYCF